MLRGLLVLLSGGIVRQLVVVATLPVLARIYGPEAFGALGAVMAIVSMGAVVIHGRYHQAIPVARDDAEARALLVLSCLMTCALAIPAAALLVLVFGTPIAGVGSLLAWVVPLTALAAVIDVLTYWRSRRRRYAASARLDAARACATVAGQFVLVPLGAAGLLLGTVLGTAIAAALAFAHAGARAFAPVRVSTLRAVALRYRQYPLLGVPQGWTASASRNLFPLLLVKFGGIALAGQYWVGYRLLMMPVALMATAYRQVALPGFRDAAPDANRGAAWQHTLALLALGLVPATLLFLHGEWLMTRALGAEWNGAGLLLGWLGLAALGDACKIPAITLLQRDGRQDAILTWELSIAGLRYVAATFLLLEGETLAAVAAFAAIGAAGWAAFVLRALAPWSRREERAPLSRG